MCAADSILVTSVTYLHDKLEIMFHRLKLQILTVHLTHDNFYQSIIHAKYDKRYRARFYCISGNNTDPIAIYTQPTTTTARV
jgi:hypothetical protein